jgi:phosphoribosylanthranilate isomerase
MVRVKICGITNLADAMAAVHAGADALGFVFWEKSPRYVEIEEAADIIRGLPPFVTTVGVFVNEAEDVIRGIVHKTGLDRVQLHGDEPPGFVKNLGPGVIKAIRVRDEEDVRRIGEYEASAYLLDTFSGDMPGGTGKTFDWDLAVRARGYGRIILSGGLNPGNVVEAVKKVAPYGVDVSSGVEFTPGKKDPEKVKAFVKLAKGAA